MSEIIYFNLLILCGFLCQIIGGTFLEDNHEYSSNIHFRRKRIIDNTRSGDARYSISDVPYIVKILQNGTQICAGIIVSPVHILTIKVCVDEPNVTMSVESGELSTNTAQIHHVESMIFEGHLALLVIKPFILLENPSLHRNIIPYNKFVWPRTHVTISGWAHMKTKTQNGELTVSTRRSSCVPVISYVGCYKHYREHKYELTQDNICTREPSGQKGCTYEDGGSALVLDYQLVGVLIFAGSILGTSSPDVFIRVDNKNAYNKWIMSYIEPYIQNEMNIPHPTNLYPRPQYPQYRDPHNEYSHPQIVYNKNSNPHTSHNHYSDPHTSHYPHASHQ